MQLKTLLNRVSHFKSFIFERIRFRHEGQREIIEVEVQPRANSRPICSGCGRRTSCYDRRPEPRRFDFVPLWNFPVVFIYRMRRVNCRRCGILTERVPWTTGKESVTYACRHFLALWARRVSWLEVARYFQTSWRKVFFSVDYVVKYGLEHRDLSGIQAIGVDEVAWKLGHQYLTVVYQLDAGCRRLLWIGQERTEESLRAFFQEFGLERTALLRFVCSDMWKPYLKVIKECARQAVHILDRFHIVAKLNKAVDEVRAKEARRLHRAGRAPVLKKSRWLLLKRRERLKGPQRGRLRELLAMNLRTVRAYLLKEDLQHLWDYREAVWAGKFLHQWTGDALRSRLEPMKKIARSLRQHEELILNWFRARKAFNSGIVEAYNGRLKLTLRRSGGWRTYRAAEVALYHTLGNLPMPPVTHQFC
jgi:transposase